MSIKSSRRSPLPAKGPRRIIGLLTALAGLALLAFQLPAPAGAEDLKKSGTVEIQQTQIAFIGSGNLGGGQLHFGGKTYKFTIGGLGIGGFGVSTIEATGTVYNLANVSQFAGTYAQGRYGYAAGSSGSGELWLQSSTGVVIQLMAKRQGLALSLGGDAIYIQLD
jgi:hypothetical protein